MLKLEMPFQEKRILLHSCCAPCSSAILECMLQNDLQPTIFYFNPNIYPLEEYEIRKAEAKRYAKSQGVPFVDADYDHESWLSAIKGLENQPEKGTRCLECFRIRLLATALYAREHGFGVFTTTLASSRWKSLPQINQAGTDAEKAVPGVRFWDQNWRRGGLQERRNQLLKENGFYNQNYCGCEFSLRARLEKEQAEPKQVLGSGCSQA